MHLQAACCVFGMIVIHAWFHIPLPTQGPCIGCGATNVGPTAAIQGFGTGRSCWNHSLLVAFRGNNGVKMFLWTMGWKPIEDKTCWLPCYLLSLSLLFLVYIEVELPLQLTEAYAGDHHHPLVDCLQRSRYLDSATFIIPVLV